MSDFRRLHVLAPTALVFFCIFYFFSIFQAELEKWKRSKRYSGLMAMLSELDISNADRSVHRQELSAGHTIITIKIASDQDEAASILTRAGATSIKTHEGVITAPQGPHRLD